MGGGTLDGMSSLVLDSISSTELDNLANNGDLKKTDLKLVMSLIKLVICQMMLLLSI